MIKIALLGGPGSGKSTQSAHFYATLRAKGEKIEQVQEWIREALNKGILNPNESNAWVQLMIYEEQKAKEDCLPKELDFMITDSPTILSYVYALRTARHGDEELLIRMYRNFLYDLNRYDRIFLCVREKPYLIDGTRRESEEMAKHIDNQIKFLLDIHNVKYHTLTGSIEERTRKIMVESGVHPDDGVKAK